MFAGLQRRDCDGRMHVRRGADPDDVDVRRRNQLRPIANWERRQRVLATEAFCAFVCGVRNRDNFNVGVFLERRQMASAHYVASPDDSDPQFVIIFVH